MMLFKDEMRNFLKEFQDELIKEDIPLWGKCTKEVGDNEHFYAKCHCGYESGHIYGSYSEAEDYESDTCPECGAFMDILSESSENPKFYPKLSEYEFVFRKDEVRLFELNADYTVIEKIDVYESYDEATEDIITNITCYLRDQECSENVFAFVTDTDAYKKLAKKKNIKIYARCECGFEESFKTLKEACAAYPTDTCPECNERSLDIVQLVDEKALENEFNKLSLNEKIKKLITDSNIIVDADGSVVELCDGTITFKAFDETYNINNITIDDGEIIVEYSDGFEIQIFLK